MRKEDIPRAHVAMHEPEPVGIAERAGEADPEDPCRLPAGRAALDALLEILAVEPLHREIHPAAAGGLSVRHVTDDRGMIEPRERVGLAREAGGELRVGHDLEGDDLAGPLVAGPVHGAGGAAADLVLDPVATAVERGPGRDAMRVRAPLRPHAVETAGKLGQELAARVARADVPLDLRARLRGQRSVDERERRILVEMVFRARHRGSQANGGARERDNGSPSLHDEPR